MPTAPGVCKSGHLCPRSSPAGAASPEDHPSRQACGASGRGCCQPGRNAAAGAALGHKGITRGFQEREGGKGRGGVWTPSPRWGAGSHLQTPEPSVPFLPERFPSPGPVALHSPSRLLYAGVRHSDPPLPRGGNSSCRSATGSTGSFGKEKVTFPALRRAWPPSPHSALRPPPPPPPTRRPLQPPKPGNSSRHQSRCACAGTWHYVAAPRAKAKGKSRREEAGGSDPPKPRPLRRSHLPRQGHASYSRPSRVATAGPNHPRGRSPALPAGEDTGSVRVLACRVFNCRRGVLLQAIESGVVFC